MQLAKLLQCSLSIWLAVMVASPAPARQTPTKEGSLARQPAPYPKEEAAGKMTLPEGFRATLFAGEPDVRQPIALAIDDRGRVWIAECYSYPNWSDEGRDRILIFEDVDGDGVFDNRKVFAKNLANLSGFALGFGGVYVCATPKLSFIPDADKDDVPDGRPVVLLDGWSMKAEHNVFNSLTWGPDGWLYGTNGILATSYIGKPGTPESERTPINCGVWRYHPVRKTFEVVCWGTTNPWGVDFDESGDAYITNCVIPHLFPVIPGGHFQRMFGQDLNRYVYELMDSCTDHIHWAGGRWQDSRGGRGSHDSVGGGHAHSGAMIYLGDNWPDAYRGNVFMCNIHGNRVNRDKMERSGSSVLARHEPDFLLAHDQWFRGLALTYGPDGSVFLIDWSDTDECHDTDANGPERETGRVYRIAYEGLHRWRGDLSKESDESLAKLMDAKNEWHVRHARRILHERASAGQDSAAAKAILEQQVNASPNPRTRLKALMTLSAIGAMSEERLASLLVDSDEEIRRWSIRMLCDAGAPTSKTIALLQTVALVDGSIRVHSALASILQRLPLEQRWEIAKRLLAKEADNADRYQPLLLWYGIEPLVKSNPSRAIELVGESKISIVRRLTARRLAEGDELGAKGREEIARVLAKNLEEPAVRDLLEGLAAALKGRKGVKPPENWDQAYAKLIESKSPDVNERLLAIDLSFGRDRSVEALSAILKDASAPLERRRIALGALLDARTPGLASVLQSLLDDSMLKGDAIRSLAAIADESTPESIIKHYNRFSTYERMDAVATLSSRPSYAKALLLAVSKGTVPARDVSTAVARQIQGFNNPELSSLLEKVWGAARETAKDKQMLVTKYKQMLTEVELAQANVSKGREVYQRTCGACHRLFGAGGEIGPDLTGSNRKNLDYLLQNILDPSASVAGEFKLIAFALDDGRVVSGIVREQNDKTIVVQTINEKLTLARDDIVETKASSASMMPEGQLEALSPEEVRDLVSYLRSDFEPALPAK